MRVFEGKDKEKRQGKGRDSANFSAKGKGKGRWYGDGGRVKTIAKDMANEKTR